MRSQQNDSGVTEKFGRRGCVVGVEFIIGNSVSLCRCVTSVLAQCRTANNATHCVDVFKSLTDNNRRFVLT